MKIIADQIVKTFQRRKVIRGVKFALESPGSLVVTGPNGSGKTTLVRIICGLLSPSSGGVHFYKKNRRLSRDEISQHLALVGPYLHFYRDLTAWENLQFFAKARFGTVDKKRVFALLDQLGLKNRHNDELKAYSSGMLQRIKYVAALYHQPELLILDEPTANLDNEGKQRVYEIIETQKKERMLIIATNEPEEIAFAAQRVDIA